MYRQQGVDINDKHIEVIVRQMMRKVRLEDAGDTNLLDGSMVDVLELENANEDSYNILRWLITHNYSEEDIAKVMGGNILRVLEQTW